MTHQRIPDRRIPDQRIPGQRTQGSAAPSAQGRLSRRALLQGASAVAGATYLDGVWRLRAASADDALVDPLTPGAQPDFSVIVRRRVDMLRLQLDIYGATLDGDSLVPVSGASSIQMVVGFPAQSVHEEAFYESATGIESALPPGEHADEVAGQSDDVNGPGDVGSRLSGPSRLVFSRATSPIPFTLQSLLDWSSWQPVLAPVAYGPSRDGAGLRPTPAPTAPSARQTSLEMPWWLLLSPLPGASWVHRIQPRTLGDRTELWHTRLGDGGGPSSSVPVKAIWALDPRLPEHLEAPRVPAVLSDGEIDFETTPSVPGVPFRGPLAPLDRGDIVISTAAHGSTGRPTNDYEPIPFDAQLLMLTGLGGHLDGHGAWPALGGHSTHTSTTLESWTHRMSGGRDHYARIVRKGYLFPFGHRASLVKVTERKFSNIWHQSASSPVPRRTRVAYLRQRYFIVVRQPIKAYPGPGQPHQGVRLPFTRIRVTSLTTPTLDVPTVAFGIPGGHNATTLFVPSINGDPFRFQMVGTDRGGRDHSFTAAAVFVSADLAFGSTHVGDDLRGAYAGLGVDDPQRTSDLGGARIIMTPTVPNVDGASDSHREVVVQQITWGGDRDYTGQGAAASEQPAFFPEMSHARVTLEALQNISGGDVGAAPPLFEYFDGYVQTNGYTTGTSPGLVFLRHSSDHDTPAGVNFAQAGGTDRSGGPINPAMTPTNIGLVKGALGGDPDKVDDNASFAALDPEDLFAAARLFGNFLLAQLVEQTGINEEDGLELKSEVTEAGVSQTTMTYRTGMKHFPSASSPLFIAGRGAEKPESDGTMPVPAELLLDVLITAPLDDGDGTYRVRGELSNFQIRLFADAPFLQLEFAVATFTVEDGTTSFDSQLAAAFFPENSPINMVQQLLDSFTEGTPWDIDLQPTFVNITFDLRLPDIPLGVAQLLDVGIFFQVRLSFLDEPLVIRFGIGSRDRPVAIVYMIFRGAFWLVLDLTVDGVQGFELGIEAGLQLSGSIGPFSASAKVAVGFIIAIGPATDVSNKGECVLTGYFRAEADINLLVVSIYILIELSLTYVPAQELCIGRAKVLIEVEVIIFSVSVEFEYEKKLSGDGSSGGSLSAFAGAAPDPTAATFADVHTPQTWTTYAQLFAGIEA